MRRWLTDEKDYHPDHEDALEFLDRTSPYHLQAMLLHLDSRRQLSAGGWWEILDVYNPMEDSDQMEQGMDCLRIWLEHFFNMATTDALSSLTFLRFTDKLYAFSDLTDLIHLFEHGQFHWNSKDWKEVLANMRKNGWLIPYLWDALQRDHAVAQSAITAADFLVFARNACKKDNPTALGQIFGTTGISGEWTPTNFLLSRLNERTQHQSIL